jgi:2'-5' RNA ligase
MKVDLARILNGIEPFNIKLRALNLFQNELYDVVKFEVEPNETLMELRKRCDGYKNEDKYPTYNPHTTLAYVKKGSFPHIKDNLNIALPITRFKYSGPSGRYFINL